MKKQILILSIILLQVNLFAQQNYVHYTVKNGLPQMQCMNLFQDSKGYIWIGTKGGLSRYDGINFKNYLVNNGLPDNYIININEDKNGNIWVLTHSGLSVLKNEQFVFYPPKKELYFTNTDLIIDNEQNIWLIEGFMRDKLIRFSNSKYEKVFLVEGKNMSILRSLSYDKQNDKIFFTEDNKVNSLLYSFKNGVVKSKTYQNSSFYLNHKENIAIKTEINKQTKQTEYTLYRFDKNDTITLFTSDKVINNPKRINDSTIVFTTYAFTANMPVQYLINDQLQENPSRFDQINDILQDTENNIWVASEKGLYKITAFNNFTEKDNMPSYVWMIQEDLNGKIWFASYNNDYLFYKQGSEIKKYSKKFHVGGFFLGAIRTKSGSIMFPYYNGIQIFNGTSFSKLNVPENRASLSVFEDAETLKLYIGNFAGLIIKDTLGKIEINKRFMKGKDDIILQIVKNKKKELWYVSRKSFGILNRTDTLVMHNDTIKGAMCLYCDYKNNLWIGTDNGLFFYNYQNFIRINHPELETMIGSIVQTDSTHFVYGGLRGIGILNLKKFYKENQKLTRLQKNNAETFVDYYTQSHGFLGEEVGQNGIFRDSKGQIWIPTNNNVVMFKPKDLKTNYKEPYTHITNFQTSQDNINWLIVNDSVTGLNYRQLNMRFDFVGISHTAPDMVKYKFRLKGFNNTWSNETKERYVTYTNLTPGNYSFELLACNNNGIWNKKPIIRAFTIKHAIWQTVWFIVAVSIVILFFIFQIVKILYKRKISKLELTDRLNNLQLQSMQSQLYPHLLFNTASAAGSVIYKENKEKAYDFVVKLSQFMRKALEDTKRLYKSLQEEVDFVENYLEIQKIRFPERFDYEFKISNDANLSLQVPQMIIQTYVENAVKYGLEPLKEGGLLKIEIIKNKQNLKIIIEDNGIGITKALKFKEKGTGSGIKIMNEIYEIHNQKKGSIISYKLIDLYKIGKKGTKSVVEIKLNENDK